MALENGSNFLFNNGQNLPAKKIKNEKVSVTEAVTETTHVLGQPDEEIVDSNDVEELHKKITCMCRFCLSEDNENLRSIFDEYNCISDMFFMFTSIQLTQNDGLPEKICFDCLNQLRNCVNFKQQVETAEAVLKHFIEEGYKTGMTLEKLETDNLEKYAQIHANHINLEFINDANDEFSGQDFTETEYYEDYDMDDQPQFPSIPTDEISIESISDISVENENRNRTDDNIVSQIPENANETDIQISNITLTLPATEILPENTETENIISNNLRHEDDLTNNIINNNTIIDNDIINFEIENTTQNPQELTTKIDENFTCSLCNANFKFKRSFLRHEKLHLSEQLKKKDYYLCTLCNQTFEGIPNEEFLKHVRGHLKNTKKAPIKRLKKILKKTNQVKEQQSSHNFCTFCNKAFENTTSDEFLKHVREHVTSKVKKQEQFCFGCNKLFENVSKSEFQKHVQSHSTIKKNLYHCNDCKASFMVEEDLHIHSSIHLDSNENGKFICRKCDKLFSDIVKLKRHVRTHFEEKPYKCEECGRGFPEMCYLKRHFEKNHAITRIEKKYTCKFCEKKYYDAYSLMVHTRTHTGEKPYICSECGKAFSDNRLLNSHRKSHLDFRQYACDHCEKKFKLKSTLESHLRLHTGVKPFACTICTKAFTQASNLRAHLRVHSGEKPYNCDICSRSFVSASSLKSHKKSHSGKKKYDCPHCDNSFYRVDLTAHLSTHKNEKPFTCEICSMSFSCAINLKKHLKTHINNLETIIDTDNPEIRISNENIVDGTSSSVANENADKEGIGKENAFEMEDDDDDAELNRSICLVNDLLAAVTESDVNTSFL